MVTRNFMNTITAPVVRTKITSSAANDDIITETCLGTGVDVVTLELLKNLVVCSHLVTLIPENKRKIKPTDNFSVTKVPLINKICFHIMLKEIEIIQHIFVDSYSSLE